MASTTTSPATEPGRHHDHDDDTDDDDDDEDDERFHREASIHALRGARSRRSSLTVLTGRALVVQGDVTRSIGGRLGGHFDSIRSCIQVDDAVHTERTPLMLRSPSTALKGSIHIISSTSPPLKLWIAPALACAGAYAFYNIFIKKGSCCVHPLLGAVILQFVAALLGSVLLGVTVWNEVGAEIHYDKVGLWWSACAGLAVGSAEMLSFFVSSLGVQASQFIPIIIGGSVMFGAVLGMILLGETMMYHGWSGIVLLVTGIALVATDPGVKVEEGGGGGGSTAALSDDDEPPPLLDWIGPALVCAMCYAFYNIFIKKGSESINPILGGVVLQLVAALFGSTLLLGTAMVDGFEGLTVTGTGLMWACCAGVSVGTAELLSFAVSGMGVDASKSIPVVIGGSVMFGAVLGLLLLGETLMAQGWSGVGLLMVGIAMVATDPGEKVAGH